MFEDIAPLLILTTTPVAVILLIMRLSGVRSRTALLVTGGLFEAGAAFVLTIGMWAMAPAGGGSMGELLLIMLVCALAGLLLGWFFSLFGKKPAPGHRLDQP